MVELVLTAGAANPRTTTTTASAPSDLDAEERAFRAAFPHFDPAGTLAELRQSEYGRPRR